jgi:hypothetical protein
VLARLAAVGPTELVEFESAYGAEEVDEVISELAEAGYPEDVHEDAGGTDSAGETGDVDRGVAVDVQVVGTLGVLSFGTVSMFGGLELEELIEDNAKLELVTKGVTDDGYGNELFDADVDADGETDSGDTVGTDDTVPFTPVPRSEIDPDDSTPLFELGAELAGPDTVYPLVLLMFPLVGAVEEGE